METMKALVKKYDKPGLWMEQVPIPEYGNNDLLVKIKNMAGKLEKKDQ